MLFSFSKYFQRKKPSLLMHIIPNKYFKDKWCNLSESCCAYKGRSYGAITKPPPMGAAVSVTEVRPMNEATGLGIGSNA